MLPILHTLVKTYGTEVGDELQPYLKKVACISPYRSKSLTLEKEIKVNNIPVSFEVELYLPHEDTFERNNVIRGDQQAQESHSLAELPLDMRRAVSVVICQILSTTTKDWDKTKWYPRKMKSWEGLSWTFSKLMSRPKTWQSVSSTKIHWRHRLCHYQSVVQILEKL